MQLNAGMILFLKPNAVLTTLKRSELLGHPFCDSFTSEGFGQRVPGSR